MPQGHHHHENKRDKRSTRLMKIAKRERENRVIVMDKPIALIDIGEQRISEVVREVCGNNNDAFQDAWCKILTSRCETENDVRLMAIEAKNHHSHPVHYFAEKSLQKPLTYDCNKRLTIEDVIASPEIVFDEPEKLKREKYSHSYLVKQGMDDDVVDLLRRKYPGESLKRALRKALGLPTLKSYHWSKAEIDLLKKRYETSSIEVLATELGRTVNSVKAKTSALKLKHKHSRITPKGAFNREDVLKIFQFSSKHLMWIVKQGKLPWRHYKNLIIFSKEDIISFIRNHPFSYRHDLLMGNSWKQYIPEELQNWITIEQTAKQVNYEASKIRRMIHKGDVPVKYYGDSWNKYTAYVRLDDVRQFLNIENMEQPYRVAWMGQKTHYVFYDAAEFLVTACQPNGYGYPKEAIKQFNLKIFTKGIPTCLKCLRILRKYETIKCNSP